MNIFKAEDGCVLRFMEEPSRNNFQSEKHGRAIFDNVLSVEVITPGSAESMPVFEIERTYCPEAGLDSNGARMVQRSERYYRFEKQVNDYRAGNPSATASGTPIEAWAQIDAGTAATLKGAGVYTVEMLADVSDGNLMHLGMGGRTLREQARNFLTSRQFGAPSAALSSEVVGLREEVARLSAENAQLKASQIAPVLTDPPVTLGEVTPPVAPEPQEPPAEPFNPADPFNLGAQPPVAAPATNLI